MSDSENALRSSMPLSIPFVSFISIHKHVKQSTPFQIGLYKLPLQLFKTFNSNQQSKDWQDLANQINITRRQVNLSAEVPTITLLV